MMSGLVKVGVNMSPSLKKWLQDYAAGIGVPYTNLIVMILNNFKESIDASRVMGNIDSIKEEISKAIVDAKAQE